MLLASQKSAVTARDVKQLSGGEKSYSTAALLISLWFGMLTAFRALDEFDVFMDPVNRKMVLRCLLDYARDSQEQYIFITPLTLDLAGFDGHEDIRIHRLSDPARGIGQ